MLLFEDQWPFEGDFDFNDAAVSYNYALTLHANGGVTSLHISLNVLAVGTQLANALALSLPVPFDSALEMQLEFRDGTVVPLVPAPGESQLVLHLTGDLRELFPDSPSPINTTESTASLPGVPLSVFVRFASPQAIDVGEAPFDLFIFRAGDSGHQIHRPEYSGTDTMNDALFGTGDDASTIDRHFVNHGGIPFVLQVPATVSWPKENVRIDDAYPDIIPFGLSGGTEHQDYYLTNVVVENLWTGGADGTPPPVPLIFVGPPERCSDGNVCTDDSCGAVGECVNIPVDGRACDDYDSCTVGDTCAGATCLAGPLRDADGDGYVDALCGGSDCDDQNAAVHELPAEIFDLRWTSSSDFGWSPAGPATFYDLTRGALADLPVGSSPSEVCLLTGTADVVVSDATPPPPAGGYWYLARGRNTCGAGSYGAGSDGLPRVDS